MEEFLRRENLKLILENIRLREQLEIKEVFVYDEEIEQQYREYYLENGNT